MITVRLLTRTAAARPCCICHRPIEPGDRYLFRLIFAEDWYSDEKVSTAHEHCAPTCSTWTPTNTPEARESARAQASRSLAWVRKHYRLDLRVGEPVLAAGEPARVLRGSNYVHVKLKGRRGEALFHPIEIKRIESKRPTGPTQGEAYYEDRGRIRDLMRLRADDLDELRAFLLAGADVAGAFPEPTPDYAGMTLQNYQEAHYLPWRAKTNPRTWVSEASHWRKILKPKPDGLGDVRLRELLEPRVVYRWLEALRAEASGGDRVGVGKHMPRPTKPASGAYKRLLRAALQALLKQAYLEGHLDQLVRLGEVQIKGSTKRALQQVDPLSIDELVRLMDAASTPKHRAMWGVGAGQGLRPSELQRMCWEDIRWASRTMLVRPDDSGEGKTASSVAEIPLTPVSFRELRSYWLHLGQPLGGLIFPSRALDGEGDPTAYSDGSAYKRALAGSATRARIGRPVTPYLLRHSFATIAWTLGIEKEVTRRIGRWTDETMLDKVYSRPRPADLVARVAAFDV